MTGGRRDYRMRPFYRPEVRMFYDLSIHQLLVVAVFSFGTQIVGGIAGYGTGLLMPLILIPLIGAEAVVPVISLAALITNPCLSGCNPHPLYVGCAVIRQARVSEWKLMF